MSDQTTIEKKQPSALQTAALVCGIVGFFTLITSIFAVIFGLITLKERPNTMAKWGIGLGTAMIIFYLLIAMTLVTLSIARDKAIEQKRLEQPQTYIQLQPRV